MMSYIDKRDKREDFEEMASSDSILVLGRDKRESRGKRERERAREPSYDVIEFDSILRDSILRYSILSDSILRDSILRANMLGSRTNPPVP